MKPTKADLFEIQVEAELTRLKAIHEARRRYDAWLAEQTAPAPEPPAIPTSPNGAKIPDHLAADARSRAILTAKASQSMFTEPELDRWQAEVKRDEDLARGFDAYGAGLFPHEENAFRRAQAMKHNKARIMLLKCDDVTTVAIQCGLSEDTVEKIMGGQIRVEILPAEGPRSFASEAARLPASAPWVRQSFAQEAQELKR